MLFYHEPDGLLAGGGVDTRGAVVPCKCKTCGRTVSSKKMKQSAQICARCRTRGGAGPRGRRR